MDTTQLIGFLAAFLTTAANIPQTYIIIRDKSTNHVSVSTYVLLLLGTGCWVTYGILKVDWPLIITNGISTLTSAIILILNFSSQKVINQVHKRVIPNSIQKEVKTAGKK